MIVIAELGINHNGNLGLAKELIDMAVECGCDAVKLQKRTIEIVYSPEELRRPRESPFGTTNGDQKRGLELGRWEYNEIDAYCLGRIDWFASAWDIPSLEFLRRYDLKYNKVASAMLTSIPFLNAVAKERKQTFVSTGMSTIAEIQQAVGVFRFHNCPFTLMHCVSTYPTPDHELNLRCIHALRSIHPHIGYSGHEISPLPSIIAVALGAEAIERHITLDRAMYGSDQSASLEKKGLEWMVDGIRRLPGYLGTGKKVITEGEKEVADKLRYFKEAA